MVVFKIMLNDLVDGILYINLDIREDRRIQLETHFQELEIKAERVQAIEAFPDMNKCNDWLSSKEKCNLAARACAASHIRAIELAYNRKWENVLIFEDDAYFLNGGLTITQKGLEQIKEIPDWDIYYLGALFEPEEIISENLLRVSYAYCTHGYFIPRSTFEYVLDNKHDIKYIDIFLSKLTNSYACYPLALIQREDTVSDLAGGRNNFLWEHWNTPYQSEKMHQLLKDKNAI